MAKILFLLLPALASAQLGVYIEVGNNNLPTKVHATGEKIGIISDVERGTFGLSEGELKDAVAKLVGRRPNDVFLHSPTPWDDLYRKYNWNQVQTKLAGVRSRVVGESIRPVIISQKHFKNNSPYVGKYNGQVSQQVWRTASTTWSKGGEITVGQEITYNIAFVAGNVGGSTSMSFNNNWGESSTKSTTTVLSSGSSITISLAPGEAANAVLNADQGSLEVEVEYEATLSGGVACHFENTFKGHYFWYYDINDVLRAAGKPTVIRSKENVKVGFYTNEKVRVFNADSNKPIA